MTTIVRVVWLSLAVTQLVTFLHAIYSSNNCLFRGPMFSVNLRERARRVARPRLWDVASETTAFAIRTLTSWTTSSQVHPCIRPFQHSIADRIEGKRDSYYLLRLVLAMASRTALQRGGSRARNASRSTGEFRSCTNGYADPRAVGIFSKRGYVGHYELQRYDRFARGCEGQRHACRLLSLGVKTIYRESQLCLARTLDNNLIIFNWTDPSHNLPSCSATSHSTPPLWPCLPSSLPPHLPNS